MYDPMARRTHHGQIVCSSFAVRLKFFNWRLVVSLNTSLTRFTVNIDWHSPAGFATQLTTIYTPIVIFSSLDQPAVALLVNMNAGEDAALAASCFFCFNLRQLLGVHKSLSGT